MVRYKGETPTVLLLDDDRAIVCNFDRAEFEETIEYENTYVYDTYMYTRNRNRILSIYRK